jgi:predicted DNA-binding transcriptional regulator AlpA
MTELLKAEDVAKLLDLSAPSIYRLAKDGIIPKPLNTGRRTLRWIKTEIENYLSECELKRVA